ncbi:MAG: family 78 glycoside hydrolase catalytic domain [Clostridia bacterium]|nr:family 78 glycoside hydrolase catalytic domain [Clostridia bacterium]
MYQEPEARSPFTGCDWLTFPEVDANLTRTIFEARDVAKASLAITALGYFEAYLNGTSLSDDRYFPPMSNYEKRDLSIINMPIFDEMDYRIYYAGYDVTDLLRDGKNVLAAHIGAGWYGQHKSQNEGMQKWGDNLLVFRLILTHADGSETSVCSAPANTKWRRSFIKESSLYYGEYQDAVLYEKNWNLPDYDDEHWLTPEVRPAPEAKLCPADFPRDRVVRTIEPKVIYIFGDRKIYDIGEEAAGYAVVTFPDCVRKNEEAVTRYADELNPDGSLNFHYCGGTNRMQRDRFVFADTGIKEFYPHFTWHAARYIELTGIAEIKEYRVVQTDLPQLSRFHSDNETLNWIFDAYVRTQQANVHGCVPSDCPHRERLGYTGDGQLTCGAVMSVFDARELYRKWTRDIRDCQDKRGGHVQHTSPFYGGGGGPGGWGGAACILPWRYYLFYGDKDMLAVSYDSMKAYLGYMVRHSEDGLVTSAEPGGWCLGDWCAPHNKNELPEPFVNTYFLKLCAEITAKTAAILGHTEDVAVYEKLAADSADALTRRYFDPATGSYCGGVQGADAYALDIGLGDERTLANLVARYEALGAQDTGIFGTYLLNKVLFEKGYGSLAFRLLTNETEVSFYNMKKHGATTLWENWDGCDSRCHPMFGAVVELFFSEILGIRRFNDEPGYGKVTVSPAAIPELKEVHGTLWTAQGEIAVNITSDNDGKKHVSVNAPEGVTVSKR